MVGSSRPSALFLDHVQKHGEFVPSMAGRRLKTDVVCRTFCHVTALSPERWSHGQVQRVLHVAFSFLTVSEGLLTVNVNYLAELVRFCSRPHSVCCQQTLSASLENILLRFVRRLFVPEIQPGT